MSVTKGKKSVYRKWTNANWRHWMMHLLQTFY